MPREIFPSSYECDCGHMSHFCENTISEMKLDSMKGRVGIGDSEKAEHIVFFHHGEMVAIQCPHGKARPKAAAAAREPGTKMIQTITVECVRGVYLHAPCVRVIEADEELSLYGLHDVIQSAVKFDRDHPFEFYAANGGSPAARKFWISQADEWEEKADEFAQIRLKDIGPLDRKRLYYHFDFGDDWVFEIRRGRKLKKAAPGVRYPRVVEKLGPNPKQYPKDAW